jgi:beta-glucosidase
VATNTDFATANLNDILDQLTLNEKVNLLGGVGWWNTYAISRLGVPSIKMSDGPNGVRGSSHFMPSKQHSDLVSSCVTDVDV